MWVRSVTLISTAMTTLCKSVLKIVVGRKLCRYASRYMMVHAGRWLWYAVYGMHEHHFTTTALHSNWCIRLSHLMVFTPLSFDACRWWNAAQMSKNFRSSPKNPLTLQLSPAHIHNTLYVLFTHSHRSNQKKKNWNSHAQSKSHLKLSMPNQICTKRCTTHRGIDVAKFETKPIYSMN